MRKAQFTMQVSLALGKDTIEWIDHRCRLMGVKSRQAIIMKIISEEMKRDEPIPKQIMSDYDSELMLLKNMVGSTIAKHRDISRSDIMRYVRHLKACDLDIISDKLESEGLIKMYRIRGAGRTATRYKLVSHLFSNPDHS